jgi:hypothetical protein
MKQRTSLILFTGLVSASAWGQDVNVYGLSMAQLWKEDTPGVSKSTFAPLTQFLGVDATKLGNENLSLHLFGWGKLDTADSSSPLLSEPKSAGDLSFGYLQYRFSQANAEIKAGRFTINQGVGLEQVDGISARTDLKGGFTLSMFGGKPVLYKSQDPKQQADYDFQRDLIFGTRLGYRISRVGEVGLSFLQDGTSPGRSLSETAPVDFTRKQMAADLRVAPISMFVLSGRTVWSLSDHSLKTDGSDSSKIAEHDYTLSVQAMPQLRIAGNYVERNFRAYYAGTNLPSLFRQDEKGRFRAQGASVTYVFTPSWELVADYRQTRRELTGDSHRFGGDLRWTSEKQGFKSGVGYHRITTAGVMPVDRLVPYFTWSHDEARAWVMYEKARFSASLDAIHLRFDDKENPNLNGKSSATEVVASAGYRTSPEFKVSADFSYGADALFKKEARGLLRAEYRFGLGGKGGSK